MYQEALRDIEENQRQNNERSYSVYTVERGRSTLITYSSNNPPRSQPTDDTIIKDYPPTYEEAIAMENIANNSTVIQVPTSTTNNSSLNPTL
ncbi:unnamed protein product [Diamesa hyperborea]